MKAKGYKLTEKLLAKAHTRDSMQALGKLTTMARSAGWRPISGGMRSARPAAGPS
jgi:hypothetical protein